ncbi:MAG: RNA polymerase sporulation sigma factor SigH [Clostridiales bacterium]|nr:RNA polymerase sporulation sigma factor SigH [Clostridiales bacterium]
MMDKIKENSLCSLSDEEVAVLAQNGSNAAFDHIIARYRNCVYGKANTYFLAGGEKEDVIQEGMIGLYKAVMEFKKDGGSSFAHFANVCISRQIISAVKAAGRKKHIPLNSYISLDKEEENDNDDLSCILEDEGQNPEKIVINQENLWGIERKINHALSKLELQVFMYYTEGMSYDEISELLDKPRKSVDNALQRVKKKLADVLEGK